MLAHHLAASTVSFCSLRFTVLHYYGIFFLGLSEVSSIFLVFVDLARFIPPPEGSVLDKFVAFVAGPIFAICFVFYRAFLWWPVSIQLFKDVYHVMVKTKQASELRPGSSWVLIVFLFLNLPLGLLQIYWITIIAEEAGKILSPGEETPHAMNVTELVQ
jgi:hypothetical protein